MNNTYSREFLLTYKQNFQIIGISEDITKEILRRALRGETRFVYPEHKFNSVNLQNELLLKLLKQKLPDVVVEYQEVKNIHGKLESGIVIDWS